MEVSVVFVLSEQLGSLPKGSIREIRAMTSIDLAT